MKGGFEIGGNDELRSDGIRMRFDANLAFAISFDSTWLRWAAQGGILGSFIVLRRRNLCSTGLHRLRSIQMQCSGS